MKSISHECPRHITTQDLHTRDICGQRAHLFAGVKEVFVGGVGDGLLELHVGGGQHHGHVALPRLAEHLEPAQHRENIHQLLAPAQHTDPSSLSGSG